MKKALKWFFNSFIWLALLMLVVDLVTKLAVVNGFAPQQAGNVEPIVLIPGFLRINYLINRNVAFGLGLGDALANRIIFIVVAILVSVGLVIYVIKKYNKLDKLTKACLMLIVSGAIGNAIDRIAYTPEFLRCDYNGVVDWIDFYGIWGFNFNIADSCVVVGAIMLIVYLIVQEIIEAKKNNAKQESVKVLSKTEKERLEEENKEHE